MTLRGVYSFVLLGWDDNNRAVGVVHDVAAGATEERAPDDAETT